MEHLITDDADSAPYKPATADKVMGFVLAVLAGFAFYGIGRFIADFFQ